MIKVYDVKCTNCGFTDEVFCENMEFGKCPECNGELVQEFKQFRFKLEYNPKTDMCSWANDGYNTSQYWNQVKKEKFETGKTPNHPGSCDTPV